MKANPEGQNKTPEGFPGFRVPEVQPEGSGCRVSSAPGLGRGIISTATRIANPELLTSCVFCYYAYDYAYSFKFISILGIGVKLDTFV